jgi:membrane protein involved in colicin uptake
MGHTPTERQRKQEIEEGKREQQKIAQELERLALADKQKQEQAIVKRQQGNAELMVRILVFVFMPC